MTRKEFLLYIGFLFLALTGIPALLKNLTNPYMLNRTNKAKTTLSKQTGFGSGSYGG